MSKKYLLRLHGTAMDRKAQNEAYPWQHKPIKHGAGHKVFYLI
jgi:hypothetical protein